jgi:hypothetical protein|nr:MAG TPA: hypothetical protein [Caudoviricetes sp.]
MKKSFYWAYRRFGTAPKYEFWFRREDDADYCLARLCPTYRYYQIFGRLVDAREQKFPEQVRTSEEMKKYVETLLRLKGVI